jgi:Uma2 family endonuclease
MNTMANESPMTAEEFATRYSDEYVELIDGRVVPIRQAGSRNGYICARVILVFGMAVETSKAWVACSNDTFVLTSRNPDRIRGADYVLWRREMIPDPMPDLIVQPPELVVEVRRPFDSISDMIQKTGDYLTAGVKVVLVLDPANETIGVFVSDSLPHRLEPRDILTLPDVLPGLSVPVKKFFE